jgi:hypothetical protein
MTPSWIADWPSVYTVHGETGDLGRMWTRDYLRLSDEEAYDLYIYPTLALAEARSARIKQKNQQPQEIT